MFKCNINRKVKGYVQESYRKVNEYRWQRRIISSNNSNIRNIKCCQHLVLSELYLLGVPCVLFTACTYLNRNRA